MDQALMLSSRRLQAAGSRLSCLSSESPMSARWADISDADSDTESFSFSLEEDTLLLPLPEATTSRSSPQTHAALNPSAPEFLPTMSMDCQLMGVGYCDMISEDSVPPQQMSWEESAFMYYVPEQSSTSLRKAKKSFWNRRRPQSLDIEAASSSSTPVQADINSQRRIRNIEAGKETKEYQFHMEQVRLHGQGVEPLTPDPADRKLSKRSWDYTVRQWRQELRSRYELHHEASRPEGTSVASTEADSHRSEFDDIATTSDDGSSASL